MAQKLNSHGKLQDFNPEDGTYGTTEKSRQERFERAQGLYGYDKNQYNHYGWARGNEILTAGQNANALSEFTLITSAMANHHKNTNGEYMIPAGENHGKHEGLKNVVVYVKGIPEIPTITKVVKISVENETVASYLRKELELYEDILWDNREGIPEAVGELFSFYNADDYKV